MRLWYTESGVQTAVDAGKSGYSGTENVATVPDHAGGEPESPPPAETTDAPDQSTQALDAIRLAACQPHVTAYFNFLLADEPVLSGWQSGALWVDRTPKDSWPAFQQAIAATTTGTVDCGCAQGRPAERRLLAAGRADRAQRRGGRRSAARRSVLERRRRTTSSPVAYRVFRNGAHVAHDLGHELVERKRRAGDHVHLRGAGDRRRPATSATHPRRSP